MMKRRLSLLILPLLTILVACERPPIDATQTGFRGTGVVDVQNPRDPKSDDEYPAPLPAVPSEGPRASEIYQNVQVLGDLSVAEFTRLMASMTAWVAPEQGCNYCHIATDLSSDDIYTKVVSRRMIQMTQAINTTWSKHTGTGGVNCFTCHRGNNVPEYLWFDADTEGSGMSAHAGQRFGQNRGAAAVAYSSLPADPFGKYLTDTSVGRARAVSSAPLSKQGTAYSSIIGTEYVYGLMMHFSQSLDVNCTYCHNTASFQNWSISSPVREKAYHGLDMVRDLNQNYLLPLQDVYPDNRLGPTGDAPKAYCLTCHQGQKKPLGGADAVSSYPSLR